MIPAGMVLVLVSLVAGWLVLAPLRRRLGAVWYHLLSYPLGLLAWSFVLAVAGLAGRPYSPAVMIIGLAAFAGVCGLLVAILVRDATPFPGPRVPWWSYVLAFSGVAAVSLAAWAFRASFSTDDSVMAYELLGVWLHDTGSLSVRVVSERSFLIPAIHAANRAFGGDWAYVHNPVLAAHAVAVVAVALWDYGVAATRRARVAVTVGTAALLGTAPAFAFHSFYVHSHMTTAAFLLIAIVALLKSTHADLRDPAPERAWLCVGGFAVAGVALARTDGLAYAFVVLAVLAALYMSSGTSRRDMLAFFACLSVTLWVPYAVAFLRLGVWSSGKLGGSTSLALLVLMAAVAGLLYLLGGSRTARRLLGSDSAALVMVLYLDALAVVALWLLKSDSFTQVLMTMAGNLARYGGYQSLWYVALLIVVASVVLSWRSLRSEWLGHVLFAVVQFMVVAVVIHVTRHPGRLSPNDSFSRVAFHIVPVVFLYGGMWAIAVSARSAELRDKALRRTRIGSNGSVSTDSE